MRRYRRLWAAPRGRGGMRGGGGGLRRARRAAVAAAWGAMGVRAAPALPPAHAMAALHVWRGLTAPGWAPPARLRPQALLARAPLQPAFAGAAFRAWHPWPGRAARPWPEALPVPA